MKKVLLGLLLVVAVLSANAQVTILGSRYQTATPSGSCALPNYLTVVTAGAGAGLYQCISGSWTKYGVAGTGLTGAGNLSPLFTTSVTSQTLNFTANAAVAANAGLFGPSSGGAGAYSFRALVLTDLPALPVQVLKGSLTYTVATSDTATIPGVTSTSGCVFSPTSTTTDPTAFVSAVAANAVTITHVATTVSGGTVSLLCTPN